MLYWCLLNDFNLQISRASLHAVLCLLNGFKCDWFTQTCHFDLTQNLNEYEKESEYTEKNLNLTTKIALLYRNLYQIQSQKISEFWVSLSEFQSISGGKKVLIIQIKSEWMAGVLVYPFKSEAKSWVESSFTVHTVFWGNPISTAPRALLELINSKKKHLLINICT